MFKASQTYFMCFKNALDFCFSSKHSLALPVRAMAFSASMLLASSLIPNDGFAQASSGVSSRTGATKSSTYNSPATIPYSEAFVDEELAAKTPPSLADIQMLEYDGKVSLFESDALEFEKLDIRLDAMREAAMSLGARAGLVNRTWEIRKTLTQREPYMDGVYDFRSLLIRAPSGLLIEPPVVSEAFDALLIEESGQIAAVTDRILNINRNAKIVSTPRNWRSYVERDWGKVQMPPSILFPKTEAEKREWTILVKKGWQEGRQQADAIFQSDLNRLVSDFNGMVRYRVLLTQGIITPPYALEIDRGVTGGGSEMRVGDRAVQITGPSQLQPDAQLWKPANR